MLTDKQAWWAHILMVALSALLVTVTWGDYFDPKVAKGVLQSLTVIYVVMGFVANGVTPPAPPLGK